MLKRNEWLVLGGLMLFASAAMAAPPNVDNVLKNFEIASTGISEKLVILAQRTAVAAALLQWTIIYAKEVYSSHEAKDWLGKGVMAISWFGVSIWSIGHLDIISGFFRQYLALASDLSGVAQGSFTPWSVIVKAREVIDATHDGIAAKLGGNWFAFGQNFLAAATLIIADLVVMAAFLILGLSLFVVTTEFWLMFAVTPLALALIPLNAMRDQGIAPIKGVFSLGLRILILGVIIAVAQSLSDTLIASIKTNGFPGDPNSGSILARMLEYHAGMLGCAAMAIYAGKIASAIASGSASFTGADAMAAGGAMMAGGAALAAGAAGGAKVISGAALTSVDGAKALGGMANAAMERAASNPFVTPSGGGGVGGSGFGQPLQSQPPGSSNSGAGNSGAGATGGSNQGAGNSGAANRGAVNSGVSSAGASNAVGGAPGGGSSGASNTGGVNSGASAAEASNAPASIGGSGNSGESNLEKFNRSSSRLMDNLAQDHANVSVSVNLGADK